MNKIKICALVLAILVLTSCTHKVYVSLQPPYDVGLVTENALSSIQPAIKFFKGKFEDKRADISKLTSFKQEVHSFNLYGKRPVEDAIFEGLQKLVTGSGHEWTDSETAEVRIDLQLLNVQSRRNAGFVKVSASSSIQIKLDFVNPKTDEVVFSDVYNGTDDRGRAMIGLMDMVKKSIHAAIVNCINNVGKDSDLAKALKKVKS